MRRLAAIVVLPLLLLGCSESGQSLMKESASKQASETMFANSPTMGQQSKDAQMLAGSSVDEAEQAPPPAAGQKHVEAVPRKIIYTAGIELIVGDLSEAESVLDDLVKRFDGMVAESDVKSDPGSPRSASWRLRIPVDRFSPFVKQLTKLGQAIKNKLESQDITDKFFDIQVRIDNKKVQVERLQKIIKEQTGKISEVLEAERELSRVTTDLEELKGTLKLWENQTALATVNVSMHERSQYVAPQAPTFANNVSRTFFDSVDALRNCGQSFALVIVALTPWLPVIAIVALASLYLYRWAQHRLVAALKSK
jgi:hypothetical protein